MQRPVWSANRPVQWSLQRTACDKHATAHIDLLCAPAYDVYLVRQGRVGIDSCGGLCAHLARALPGLGRWHCTRHVWPKLDASRCALPSMTLVALQATTNTLAWWCCRPHRWYLKKTFFLVGSTRGQQKWRSCLLLNGLVSPGPCVDHESPESKKTSAEYSFSVGNRPQVHAQAAAAHPGPALSVERHSSARLEVPFGSRIR